MANILFLSHRIPYPPNKGDKIRSWNFLSRLSDDHTVHLGFYVDNPNDLQYVPKLKDQFASVCYEQVNPLVQKVRSLLGLLNGKSLTECAYPPRKLKKYCNDLISNQQIDLVFLFSAATAPLIEARSDVRVVADLVDVDSQKWGSYAKAARWPLSWLYKREARKLAAFETHVATRAFKTIFVSNDEACLFQTLNPALKDKIIGIANGVDTDFFDPKKYSFKSRGQKIIFTGAMDYHPNIEAAEWFCNNVWPHVLLKNPGAEFLIAGGPITSRSRKLALQTGVCVLGYVEDMAATISGAQIVVAPLQTARGIQNKVLEAMSMAKPVVATQLANEGINAQANIHICIADTGPQFCDAICNLLEDHTIGERLGKSARSYVKQNFSWERSYAQLNALLSESRDDS